ncbi:hypothetical protein DFH08DRAFT_802045 [Mycena albidolilacea]|uniref:Uncharacterized protein n=1 Tax=Mycena albidolilacea TaxID=1033008 RepID=A0AAD7AGI4_9AGAR|nr:hypothetical protein DFH08DRAFT_802045 [Mycena albidolilacea]
MRRPMLRCDFHKAPKEIREKLKEAREIYGNKCSSGPYQGKKSRAVQGQLSETVLSPCTVCHDQELTSPKKLRRRTLAICVVNKLILWRVNDPVHDLNSKQLLVLLPTSSATGSHLTQLKFNSSSRVISVEISQVLSHFCGRALIPIAASTSSQIPTEFNRSSADFILIAEGLDLRLLEVTNGTVSKDWRGIANDSSRVDGVGSLGTGYSTQRESIIPGFYWTKAQWKRVVMG